MKQKTVLLLQKNKLKNYFNNLKCVELLELKDFYEDEYRVFKSRFNRFNDSNFDEYIIMDRCKELVSWAVEKISCYNISNEVYMQALSVPIGIGAVHLWVAKIKILDWFDFIYSQLYEEDGFFIYDALNDKTVCMSSGYENEYINDYYIKIR